MVVVGGGISGLAAAWFLLDGTDAQTRPRVTVLEESTRLGGKLHADEIAGVSVDLGAEAMLARRPEAVDLACAVGLDDELTAPATTTARLWTRGGLRPLPRGQLLGVPGDLAPLAASGVLSAPGLARLPLDHVLPRTPVHDDVAVGAFAAARLGHEVVDRLVQPLLGGVYAGDAYRLSMRAAAPALFAAMRDRRSLIEAVRHLQRASATASAAKPAEPVFMGIRGGVGRLPHAVAVAVRATGGQIRTGTAVTGLRRTGPGWQLTVTQAQGTTVIDADAVVLAVPAPATARLLTAEAPPAAAELADVEYASMALVTMAFRRGDLAHVPAGSGFLVPPVDGRTIKAATFSSHKWNWTAEADPDTFILRTSVGRHGEEADLAWDDTDLVRLSRADLREAVGLTATPTAARVTRWYDGLPQYAVGHVERVARIRSAVAKLPGLAVCGALYDGVGIPACIASAQRAARALTAAEPPADRGPH